MTAVLAAGVQPGLLENRDESDRLAVILAEAASAEDRGSGLGFESVAGAEVLANDAASAWLHRAAGPHAEELRGYLARTGRDLRQSLAPVRWVPGAQPGWVRALVTFLQAQPATEDDTRAEDFGVRTAAGLLKVPIAITVSQSARTSLNATLTARLYEATQRSGTAATREGWLRLFEAAPGLAYVVGTTCANWAAAANEMFDRLRTDWTLLQSELFDGTDPGAVVAIRADAGDRHASGRSVALLDFAGGRSVVYKSKDLQHVAAFQALLEAVNAASDPAGRLQTRRVVLRDGYGWEERVIATPCPDEESFPRFYHRLGRLTRLLQLVAGRDMWADNLLADGEHPVVIDLECMLFATSRALPGLQLDTAATDALNDTVVATSMVCQPWSAPLTTPVLDVGCLSRSSDLLREDGSPLLPLPQYRPRTATTTADPWRYADDVIAGYSSMHRTLRRLAPQLLLDASPLTALSGAPVRHIRRNTWDCYQLIRISVGAEALAGGVQRETVLAGLMRSVFTVAGVDRPDLIEMVLSEISALRALDIPLLASRPDSDSVFDAHGTELGTHFQGKAFDQLRNRVVGLAHFDLDWHVAVLRACLDAARDGAEGPVVPSRRRAPLPHPDQLVEAAAGIGTTLLEARCSSGDWIAQTWHPVTGLRTVEAIGSDLAAGTAGIAVVLAELAAVTGNDHFRRVSVDALAAATQLAHAMPAGPSHQRIAGPAYVPGGLAGTGAVLHALARVGDRLAEPSLLAAATELLPQLTAALSDLPRGERRPFTDLPTGLAGLLLNLLRLRQATGATPAIDAAVGRCAQQLGRDLANPRYSSKAARVVPCGLDSAMMAFARLAFLAPELVPAGAPDWRQHRFPGNSVGSLLAQRDSCVTGAEREPTALGNGSVPAELTGLQLLSTIATTDRERALPFAAELLDRRHRTGRWFAERCTDDLLNLGQLDGIGAVALSLLSVARSDVHPLTTLR